MRELASTSSMVGPAFPAHVGAFSFVRELSTASHSQNYLFGLYKSDSGEDAILKLWLRSGSSSYARRMLVNEINNYKALTTLKKQVEGVSNNYRIPTFYGGAVTANSCWLLLEYVPTTQSNAQEFTEHDYALARDYVAQIGRLPNAANMFRTLSFWGLLMGFLPGLVFVSLRSQVFLKHSVSIARDFLAVMGSLLSPEGKSLSHLDLKPENILESNGKKYLIDFQFLAFVHPMYELAFLWDRSFVIQQSSQHIANIVERLVKGLSPKELRLVRVLVTYGLLYDILVDHEQPLPVHERALEKLISL